MLCHTAEVLTDDVKWTGGSNPPSLLGPSNAALEELGGEKGGRTGKGETTASSLTLDETRSGESPEEGVSDFPGSV